MGLYGQDGIQLPGGPQFREPDQRMRFRANPIRAAGDLLPEGEAALDAWSAVGTPGNGGQPGSGAGFSAPGVTAFGVHGLNGAVSAMAAHAGGDKPGDAHGWEHTADRAGLSPSEGGKSTPESAENPQQSIGDGVPEDMATLVLDNPALGAGPASGSDSGPEEQLGGAAILTAAAAVDPASDAAIMLRVAAGDEAGFNYLVEKYHRAMIHFLFRMVRNQAVAEELAQEVFLRVYRSRESYRAEAKFTTWLYRIATNLAVNHARDTKHERAAQNIYLDAPDEETGTTPEVADDEPSVEQRMMRDERMAAIRKHVVALPERQRMAVLMHKYQGMDYRQIGEVLKLSESATKSLLFRAYQTLRDKLKEFV